MKWIIFGLILLVVVAGCGPSLEEQQQDALEDNEDIIVGDSDEGVPLQGGEDTPGTRANPEVMETS